ncbi:hypothetical protein [Brachybacterium sp. J153]|uniref:hypothetical protein n=1 Tax=Brachybacterium sp. J153 TaxID=3116488 RepID=UPI002E777DEF|nr:hypothetical protein [Brachybacterium sp. J153]MEE1617283.1 hypothetical protein [Brachybacterium sp. J153]
MDGGAVGEGGGPAAGRPPGPHRGVDLALRILGAVVLIGGGVMWIRMIAAVVGSRFDPGSDPHGYGLILGMVFGIPFGLAAAVGAGLLAPRGRRSVVLAAAFGVWFLVTAVLLVLILTMPRWEPPGGIPTSKSLSEAPWLSSSASVEAVADGAATEPRAAQFAS